MVRRQMASVVSSIGAAEAMPALATRISRPPNSRAAKAAPAIDRGLVGDVHRGAADAVARRTCAESSASAAASAAASMSASTTQAPSASSRSAVAPADAAGAAGDQRDAAFQRRGRRHAPQLRLLQRPVLDVESLLLRQAQVAADRLGAAHDVDGVAVELRGDPRRGLVLGEGEHAEPRMQHDHRVGVAQRRAARLGAAFVVAGVGRRDRPRTPRARYVSPSRSSRPGSSSSGLTLVRRKWSGQEVPSSASRAASREPTNSSVSGDVVEVQDLAGLVAGQRAQLRQRARRRPRRARAASSAVIASPPNAGRLASRSFR